MTSKHPFDKLSFTTQKRSFVILLILTLSVMIGLQIFDKPLKTTVAPAGIVSFEFAGNPDSARAIIDSWEETGKVYAGLSLGLDFLFLLLYAGCIAMGCVIVTGNLKGRSYVLYKSGIFSTDCRESEPIFFDKSSDIKHFPYTAKYSELLLILSAEFSANV